MSRYLCRTGLLVASVLLGSWSSAAAPPQGRCAFGVTITASQVSFEGIRVPTRGARFTCLQVSRDPASGLVVVEPLVGNAREDAEILYFKPKVGLIWRTSAQLIGATKDEYLFASDNDDEPPEEAQVYRIQKSTLARRVTRIPFQARPGCGPLEIGQGTTFQPPNVIQSSRLDACGLFFKTIVLK